MSQVPKRRSQRFINNRSFEYDSNSSCVEENQSAIHDLMVFNNLGSVWLQCTPSPKKVNKRRDSLFIPNRKRQNVLDDVSSFFDNNSDFENDTSCLLDEAVELSRDKSNTSISPYNDVDDLDTKSPLDYCLKNDDVSFVNSPNFNLSDELQTLDLNYESPLTLTSPRNLNKEKSSYNCHQMYSVSHNTDLCVGFFDINGRTYKALNTGFFEENSPQTENNSFSNNFSNIPADFNLFGSPQLEKSDNQQQLLNISEGNSVFTKGDGELLLVNDLNNEENAASFNTDNKDIHEPYFDTSLHKNCVTSTKSVSTLSTEIIPHHQSKDTVIAEIQPSFVKPEDNFLSDTYITYLRQSNAFSSRKNEGLMIESDNMDALSKIRSSYACITDEILEKDTTFSHSTDAEIGVDLLQNNNSCLESPQCLSASATTNSETITDSLIAGQASNENMKLKSSQKNFKTTECSLVSAPADMETLPIDIKEEIPSVPQIDHYSSIDDNKNFEEISLGNINNDVLVSHNCIKESVGEQYSQQKLIKKKTRNTTESSSLSDRNHSLIVSSDDEVEILSDNITRRKSSRKTVKTEFYDSISSRLRMTKSLNQNEKHKEQIDMKQVIAIYTERNYIAPITKGYETIMESKVSTSKKKFHRFIAFEDSKRLKRKLKQRVKKAEKLGWKHSSGSITDEEVTSKIEQIVGLNVF